MVQLLLSTAIEETLSPSGTARVTTWYRQFLPTVLASPHLKVRSLNILFRPCTLL